jgi:hypothetical protein
MDTVLKRRAALGRSVVMLPSTDGTIGKDDRAIFLGLYLPYTPVSIVTPAARIYAIARQSRVYPVRLQ